jgi:WD40 repeat protein
MRLAISPDGRLMASTNNDSAVRIWDLHKRKVLASLPASVYSVLFAHDGRSLLTSGPSGVQRWPIERAEGSLPGQKRLVIGRSEPVAAVASYQGFSRLSRDGRKLIVGDRYQRDRAAIVDFDAPEKSVILQGHTNLRFVALSPDGSQAVSGAWHAGGVKVWDAQTGECRQEWPEFRSARVAFSPDGRWLVIGTYDKYLLHSRRDGLWQAVREIPRPTRDPPNGAMAFTRDGRILATVHSLDQVKLFDLASGHELATLPPPRQSVMDWLCISPAGSQLLAAATSTGEIHQWDLRRIRQQLAELGLDWDAQPLPPAVPHEGDSLTIDVVSQ